MSYLVMDVSKYNTVTSWSSVAGEIDGVIIRCGYRGYGSSGTIVKDTSFSSHISGAAAAGIPLSVYFFTQATSSAEAIEEAEYTLSLISGYTISLPIFVDSEYSNSDHDGRADSLSASNRTTYLKAFCDTINAAGYTAGIYASDSWYNTMVNLSSLTSYKLWVARYSSTSPIYVDDYIGWQYTSSGTITGVSGNCDLSHWYEEIGESSTEKDPDKYYYDTYTGTSVSLVTGLAAVGCLDTSYSYRKVIAAANDISGYSGTSTQNTYMLNLLKSGLLIDPSGGDTTGPTITVSSNTCSGSGTAVVTITDDVYVSSVTIDGTSQDLASSYTLTTSGTKYVIVATDAAGNSTTKNVTVASHSYKSVVTAPTCTAQGYTTYTCSTCGNSYKGNYTSATGHTYVTTETLDATCTEQGYTVYTCKDCDDSYTEYTEPLGHNYLASTVIEPTCTTDGYTIYECENCGDSYKGSITSALGHNFVTLIETVDPTCTENGYDIYECNRCGAKTTLNETDATGHNYEVVEIVDPTCLVAGYTIYTCTYCGETFKGDATSATGHICDTPVFTWGSEYTTCTATFTCNNCGEVIILDCTVYTYTTEGFCTEGGTTIYSATVTYNGARYTSNKEITSDPVGHKYVDTVVEPSCVSQGYTQHTCSVCEDSYKDNYVDALGHDYQETEGSTVTCTTAGYIAYKCTRCGNIIYSEYTEALGHDYTEKIILPTCTDYGYTINTCKRCGEIDYTNYVSPLGHNYKYQETDENGNNIYCCTRCGLTVTGSDIEDGSNLFSGTVAELINAPLYSTPNSWISEYTATGTFYIWDPTVTNGRVMVTNKSDYTNQAQLVTGWIDISEIGKTIVVTSGTKYGLGDEILAQELNLYETASSNKIIAIKNGYLYVNSSIVKNERLAVTDDESLVGEEDSTIGWVKGEDL